MKKRVLSFLLSFLMIISLTPSVLLTAMEVKAEVATPSASDSSYTNPNLPAVRNQGSLGLCWAFSTIAACEAELIQNNGASNSLDLSELHLGYFGFNRSADPLGNYTAGKNQLQNLNNPAEPKDWESRGHNQYAAMNALAAWSGVVTETTTPYVSTKEDAWDYFNAKTDEQLAALSYDNDVYHLENAYMIDRNNPEDIKQAILDYGGVIVGINANNGWLVDSSNYDKTNHSMYHASNADTDHEVLIVGWDDDFNDFNLTTKPENSGAWLLRNSWGTTFGDNGYFWMSYEDKTISRWLYAYDMESADNFDNNYQYNNDITGMFSGEDVTDDIYDYTPKNQSTGSAANVFEIKANPSGYETLKAVSFMTYAANGNYTIKIYKNLTNDSYPESGTLISTTTGSYKYAGYHTIKLDSPIAVAEGSRISVVVDIKDNNGKSLGLAAVENSLGIDATAVAGQSFLTSYGAWYDQATVNPLAALAVVPIKLFTDNKTSSAPTAISIEEEDIYLSNNSLGYYVTPSITGSTYSHLTWTSSDETVATVRADGKVKPLKNGDCTITATTDNGLSDSCTVHIVSGPAQVTFVQNMQNKVIWNTDSNADGYFITACPSEQGTYITVGDVTNSGSATITLDPSTLVGVQEGYSYYVKIVPYKFYGENNEYKVTGPVGVYEYRFATIPYSNTITNLTITDTTATSISLSWNGFDGIDHYSVRYTGTNGFRNISVSNTSYTITDLAPETTYEINVCGVGPTMLGSRCAYTTLVSISGTTLSETPVSQYTINFNANGGSGTMSAMTCNVDENYTLSANSFTKSGYTFIGWNTKKDGTGSSYSNKKTIKNLCTTNGATITFYAQWAKSAYTISFNANGGSGKMASLACKYGTAKALTANAFTRKGYTFVGWNTKKDGTGTTYANKASVTNLTKTGAITLYAKWTKTKYTITYYLYGGKNSTSNPSYYYITSAKITLKNPTRAGYTFGGWYSDSKFKTKVTTIAAGSTGAKKLYAKWTVNTYNLAYNANGGTGKMTGKSGIKYDSSFTLASNTFTRKGYTFAGWSTSKTGKVLYKNKASVKNLTATNKKTVTLYAIWTKTKYTITYYLDGGTNSSSNPAYYYITTGKITLKNPTKTGYTFGGWYADSKFKTKVTTIAAGSTKSMKLYAKWTAKSFTVSFNMNGGSGSKTAIKTTSGKTIDLRATSNMKLVGYDFKNWNTKADGTGTMYSAKSAVAIVANGNITLYAIWGMQEPTYSVENRTITVTKGYDFNINSEFIQNILPESQRNEEGTTYFVNDCTITGSGYERLLYGKLQKKESDGSLSAYDGKFRTAEEWAEIDRLYRAQQKPNTWTYVKENGSHAIRITGTEDITITIPSYSLPDGSTMSLTFTIKVRQ